MCPNVPCIKDPTYSTNVSTSRRKHVSTYAQSQVAAPPLLQGTRSGARVDARDEQRTTEEQPEQSQGSSNDQAHPFDSILLGGTQANVALLVEPGQSWRKRLVQETAHEVLKAAGQVLHSSVPSHIKRRLSTLNEIYD